jgi:uncharacterized Ntn-hydrolase superfamily protein
MPGPRSSIGSSRSSTGTVARPGSTASASCRPITLRRPLEAGYQAGGELKQEKSAALLVVHKEAFPLVDLRVDYDRAAISQLRFLWENYTPVMASYVERALDPEATKYWVK